MTNDSEKKILIICRRPPYGNSLAREALEVTLAASAFDQDISILFTGDGVFQLLKDQSSDSIASKNHLKLLAAFPLYDIEQLFVDRHSLDERKLSEHNCCLPIQLIDDASCRTFLRQFNSVLSF